MATFVLTESAHGRYPERVMIACCNDDTRPVVFKIERIDVPDTSEDEAWHASHDFTIHREDAYTGA